MEGLGTRLGFQLCLSILWNFNLLLVYNCSKDIYYNLLLPYINKMTFGTLIGNLTVKF